MIDLLEMYEENCNWADDRRLDINLVQRNLLINYLLNKTVSSSICPPTDIGGVKVHR